MKWKKHLKSAINTIKTRNPISRSLAEKNVKNDESRGFMKTLRENNKKYFLESSHRSRRANKSKEIYERETHRGKNHNLGNGNANSGYRKKKTIK